MKVTTMMMKTPLLLLGALLALGTSAFAADPHGHDHAQKALHGGIVAEANHLEFELVAKAGQINLHVRDHGKPASVQGASAKLTLLQGSEKRELPLTPEGDTLEAQGSFKLGPGTKAVATVTLAGKKPVNVRFALK